MAEVFKSPVPDIAVPLEYDTRTVAPPDPVELEELIDEYDTEPAEETDSD